MNKNENRISSTNRLRIRFGGFFSIVKIQVASSIVDADLLTPSLHRLNKNFALDSYFRGAVFGCGIQPVNDGAQHNSVCVNSKMRWKSRQTKKPKKKHTTNRKSDKDPNLLFKKRLASIFFTLFCSLFNPVFTPRNISTYLRFCGVDLCSVVFPYCFSSRQNRSGVFFFLFSLHNFIFRFSNSNSNRAIPAKYDVLFFGFLLSPANSAHTMHNKNIFTQTR